MTVKVSFDNFTWQVMSGSVIVTLA